jgi:hypothetical protein
LTWPYHCSLFFSMMSMKSSFPFTPIISFIFSFFIFSNLDILATIDRSQWGNQLNTLSLSQTLYCVVILYISVSQTVVRGPPVVLGICPRCPLRLNIRPKKTENIKLTWIAYHTL